MLPLSREGSQIAMFMAKMIRKVKVAGKFKLTSWLLFIFNVEDLIKSTTEHQKKEGTQARIQSILKERTGGMKEQRLF